MKGAHMSVLQSCIRHHLLPVHHLSCILPLTPPPLQLLVINTDINTLVIVEIPGAGGTSWDA